MEMPWEHVCGSHRVRAQGSLLPVPPYQTASPQSPIVGVAFALIGLLELSSCDLPALHVFVYFKNELDGARPHSEFPIVTLPLAEQLSVCCARSSSQGQPAPSHPAA